jgi:hypothetical protein
MQEKAFPAGSMSYAIIRGKGGRRHEVDFGDSPVQIKIYSSENSIEIFVEADCDTLPEHRRRFAILHVPKHLFSEVTGAEARQHAKPSLSY